MKNARLLKFCLLILLPLFSCKKDNEPNKNPVVKNHSTKQIAGESSSLINKTFLHFAFPQQVQGCSCYFAENRKQFIKQNYIYVDDFGKSSFVQIHESVLEIPYGNSNHEDSLNQLNINSKNGTYEVSIKAEKIEHGESESALYQGTIILRSADGTQIVSPIYGECGC